MNQQDINNTPSSSNDNSSSNKIINVKIINATRINNTIDNNNIDTITNNTLNINTSNNNSSFIAYNIKINNNYIIKRRYSNFENLRFILIKLFPLKLIPSIPEKENIIFNNFFFFKKNINSTTTSSNTNNNNTIINHRIKFLNQFLSYLLLDSDISNTFILLNFLDPNILNWNDFIITNPTINSSNFLNKNILQLDPKDTINTNSDIYDNLPIVKSSELDSPSYKDHHIFSKIIKIDLLKFIKNFIDFFLSYLKNLNNSFILITNDLSFNINRDIPSPIHIKNLIKLLNVTIIDTLYELTYLNNSLLELLKFYDLKILQLNLLNKKLLKNQKKYQISLNSSSSSSTTTQQSFLSSITNKLLLKNDYDPHSINENIINIKKLIEITQNDLSFIKNNIITELDKYISIRNDKMNFFLKFFTKLMKDYSNESLIYWKKIRNISESTSI